jgi:two-component system LytT family sensor kinase
VPVVGMFLGSIALHPVCRWLLRQPQSWFAFELKAAVCSVLASTLSACGTGLWLHSFNRTDWFSLVSYWMWSSFVLFMWCSLYFSIKQWQQSTEEKQRLLRAETEVRDARLLALRYQLNPHFLFNSLNAVSTLILDGKGSAATEMLAQIGEFLRSSLDSEVKTEVAFSDEIELTERYLAIEQTRLGDRLRFELAVAPETRNALVPSMLLQPLVENAVRYGVSPLVEGGWIGISSSVQSNQLQIVIHNSGERRSGEQRMNRNGVGLGNTEDRLKTLYGTNYRFSLEWPESGGCQVTVELPYRTSEDLKEAAHARIDR